MAEEVSVVWIMVEGRFGGLITTGGVETNAVAKAKRADTAGALTVCGEVGREGGEVGIRPGVVEIGVGSEEVEAGGPGLETSKGHAGGILNDDAADAEDHVCCVVSGDVADEGGVPYGHGILCPPQFL